MYCLHLGSQVVAVILGRHESVGLQKLNPVESSQQEYHEFVGANGSVSILTGSLSLQTKYRRLRH